MTTKASKKRGYRRTASRPPAALTRHVERPVQRANLARHRRADTTAGGMYPRPARRPGGRKEHERVNEWLKAGAVVVVFLAAVILAAHVLGGSGTPSAPPAAASTDQPAASSTGSPGGSGSGTFISGGNGQTIAPVTETAQALGISPATLRADIQAGQTVAQLAQEQHVSLDTVNAAYLRGVQELLNSYLQEGAFDQATADQVYQREMQQVQEGVYDMLQSHQTIGG